MLENETSKAISSTLHRIYRNIETLKAMEYGCSLIAMRELLDDPEWAPEEIVDFIVAHKGLHSDKINLLERYASVKVIGEGQLRTLNEREVIISTADEPPRILQKSERVVISYITDAETRSAHMECIDVGDIDRECLFFLIIRRVPSGD